MKKAQFDVEDVFALLLWLMIILLFVILFQMGGCSQQASQASIGSENKNPLDVTRTLLSCLNQNVEYKGRNLTISGLITQLYLSQDIVERDKIQKLLDSEVKEALNDWECWVITILGNPRIEIASSKCSNLGSLEVLLDRGEARTKIPAGEGIIEILYQEFGIGQKEVAGKH